MLTSCGDRADHQRKSPLPSQAFVWQRRWTSQVSQAVQNAQSFEALHFLAAEVRFKDGKPMIERFEPDRQALKTFRGQTGVVLRIHASAAVTGWDDRAQAEIVRLSQEITSAWEKAGQKTAEIQIDYDCPESKLADYARLLTTLKKTMPDMPICITALPSWFRQPGVRSLVALSPGYVLQVHSLHLPKQGGRVTLMDETEAREAVRSAAEIGVPFRVALPTYSCVVLLNDDGKVAEVFGEDLPSEFSAKGRRHLVLDADAYALNALMDEWRLHAPETMNSVIWYRLPVTSDRLNWPAATLQKIVADVPLKRGWTAKGRRREAGLWDIVLTQSGDAPDDLPREIQIEWNGEMAEAADGLRGYQVSQQAPGWLRLSLTRPAQQARLWPGAETVAGWVRVESDLLKVKPKR